MYLIGYLNLYILVKYVYMCISYAHFCSFLNAAWKFGREDWLHEFETACRFGKLKGFRFFYDRIKKRLTELV